MNTDKSEENLSKSGDILPGKQTPEKNSEKQEFHQLFTSHIIGVFILVAVLLISSVWLLSQQYKFSQTLITEQLTPLKTQLLQQGYLINSNELIDEIFQNSKINETVILLENLSLQSKKLSLLKSEQKSNYQQWFSNNNDATTLITNIVSNYQKHIVLRENALIQIDTLLDAIKIELANNKISSKQYELLTKIDNKLSDIVIKLKGLNLQTPLDIFVPLSNQIHEMFVEDYTKQLANLQYENQGIADIVRDFLRFEDLILKHGLLVKWQAQLSLMKDYHLQLTSQQQQLQSILNGLVKKSLAESNLVTSTINDSAVINKQIITVLPRWIYIALFLPLASIAGLLLLIRNRIKVANQVNVNIIRRCVQGEGRLLINNENNIIQQKIKSFYSAEFEQLLNEIQQSRASSYSEKEFLSLTEKNLELEDQVIKHLAKQDKLEIELELIGVKNSEKSILEQHCLNNLHIVAIKQLVFLGNNAVDSKQNITNLNNHSGDSREENNLYSAHIHARYLVRKLRQINYYQYLQTGEAVLTLSDVNLAAQIQAVLFNFRNKLQACKNVVLVNIDEKINIGVNLDAELFCEMLNVFIGLSFSQQKGIHLALSIKLVDKNNGQQKISFSAQVSSKNEILPLPKVLKFFNDESEEQNELGDYFCILLRYQHGDEVVAQSNDEGYSFGFNLSLAVTKSIVQKNYPLQVFPDYLPAIENSCKALFNKYITMPIEVLIAVKEPNEFQKLQQFLHILGLQTTFVTTKLMLKTTWQSGRFSVLMTDIDCKPFIDFLVDEPKDSSTDLAVIKGVFSLANVVNISTKSDEYSHWFTGKLDAQTGIDELISVMAPWINEQEGYSSENDNSSNINNQSDSSVIPIKEFSGFEVVEQKSTPIKQEGSFDFDRYIKHQGSAELALFMLEEYTTENKVLVEQLSQSFAINDSKNAEAAIQALTVNSKILAADHLLEHCQHWKKLLTSQGLDYSDKAQVNLLSKTEQAVQDVSQYADAVA